MSCLESVTVHGSELAPEVIVVDNDSNDGTLESLAERFPNVTTVPLRENTGFSHACNVGWRRARGRLVLFLNSDTAVGPRVLSGLVRAADGHPEAGIIGPLLRNADGSVQMSHGKMLSLFSEAMQKLVNFGYRHGKGPLRGYVESIHSRERYVDWVSGACLLARRRVLEAVSGFDEGFFLYSEDVDLCARARAAGYRVLFTPSVEILHHRGRSTARVPERAFVESQKSRLYFYRKHYGPLRVGLLELYMALRLGLSYVLKPSSRTACRSVFEALRPGARA